MVQYLKHTGRDNFISILYGVDGRTTGALNEALNRTLRGSNMFAHQHVFINRDKEGFRGIFYEDNTIWTALRQFKDQGNFRTIVVLLDPPNKNQTLPLLAQAAENLEMNTGEHVWIFFGSPFLPIVEGELREDGLTVKLLQGAALITYVDGFMVDGQIDPFLQSWKNQSTDMVETLNIMNPLEPGSHGYYAIEDDYFQLHSPTHGASYVYDSVIATGMGACLAGSTTNFTGLDHSIGIEAVSFQGASGRVEFGRSRQGTRNLTSGMYGDFNLLPPGSDKPYVLTDLLDPTRNSKTIDNSRENVTNITDVDPESWISIDMFIYASNTPTPPALLRDDGYGNYLSRWAHITGLTLFAISSLLSVASMIWIANYRFDSVILAAQPIFPFFICLGALLQACCIPFLSFDESYGVSLDRLSSFCVAVPWLFVVGNNMTYVAIFGKPWRVNKVLQFTHVKIETWKIVPPLFILFMTPVVLLSAWTVAEDYGWYRQTIDEISGETYGVCQNLDGTGSSFWLFAVTLFTCFIIALTSVMAWKTKDVEDSFAESWWVFALVFVRLQASIVALPMIFLFRTISTDGRYLLVVLLITTFSVSSIILIMLPKVLAFFEIYGGETALRGARDGTRVTGISGVSGTSIRYTSERSIGV
ncbi:7 transmembrane sweet-taste receptor of 3 GCPR [Nitzschia inconspicua]|uniref:7 transmembrane sweet-taste receptor of 3 GCPR n=1 Tax=Nitzschia inconspicua TaxID=303405 RepID=A0A9K3M2F8_9STRA|nr:7 transmembrane sweet-taste receptor of 3 GCPR [Nitzschia inconspicua]